MTARSAAILLAASLASACAGIDYAMTHYSGVEVVSYRVTEGPGAPMSFRIFDKPGENRLMITPGLGEAAGMGFASGLTLNAVRVERPIVVYRDAALAWLATTGRSCRVDDAFEITRAQFEVRYACGLAEAPAPEQMPPTGAR